MKIKTSIFFGCLLVVLGGQGYAQGKDTLRVSGTALVAPQFPGGMDGFAKYIRANVKQLEGTQPNLKGMVYTMFIIAENGEVDQQSIRVLPLDELKEKQKNIKDEDIILQAHYQEEAIRLKKSCPKWTPGSEKGKPVRQRMLIPINFK